MNTDPHDLSDAESSAGSPGIRTLSDAKTWLANLARNGASEVHIKEPYREIGGGLLVVTASLVRADGARVNVEVYCYDDRGPASVKADLFPLPPATALPGVN